MAQYKAPNINTQRHEHTGPTTHSKTQTTDDAKHIFPKYTIEYETEEGHVGIVLGYDRNYDAVVVAELTDNGGMRLVIVDTAWLDDCPATLPRVDTKAMYTEKLADCDDDILREAYERK